MRLDFDNFDITETTAGVCTDSFAMTGPSGQNPLNLCGTLTGAHSEYKKLQYKKCRNVRIIYYFLTPLPPCLHFYYIRLLCT